MFVDLDIASADRITRLPDQLRRAPRGFFNHAHALLIRWPNSFGKLRADSLDPVADQIQVLAGRDLAVGGVKFAQATLPDVVWHQLPEGIDTSAALVRARAVEVAALLDWGRAVWAPPGYHYQLPSKEHAERFIRVADAIRSPRDADVIASWLFPYLGPGLSLVLDSSSLISIAQALRAELRSAGSDLGPVVVLDNYPETDLEYEALVARTGGAGTLAILSVSSTNRTRDGLRRALDRQAAAGWRLEILVNRAGAQANDYPSEVELQGTGDAWLGLDGGRTYPATECDLCKGDRKRPYVYIDPHTFSALVLPEPPLVAMPDVKQDHEKLLQFYDRVDAIGVESAPPRRTELRRGKGLSAIRFYPHELLKAEGFLPAAEEQLRARIKEGGSRRDGWSDVSLFQGYDAIVALDEDYKATGFAEFLEMIDTVIGSTGTPKHVVLTGSPGIAAEEKDAAARADLEQSEKILIITVGAVTGGTLQELLSRVHRAKHHQPQGSYSISGLAMHARPSTFREWETLCNSFGGALLALWVTYLPWRSVLDEEMRLLEQLAPSQQDDFRALRERYCEPATSDWAIRREDFEEFGGIHPHALFWGIPVEGPPPELLATSRFGHEVRPIAALVGMGAAMHRARLDNRRKGAPPWMHFEMAALGTSYFDTLLFVSALRWLEPYEGHWEAEGRGVAAVLSEVWHRVDGSERDKQIILAELLLAAAQAKLPRAAQPWLADKVKEVEGRWTDGQMSPIRLGEELLRLAYRDIERID